MEKEKPSFVTQNEALKVLTSQLKNILSANHVGACSEKPAASGASIVSSYISRLAQRLASDADERRSREAVGLHALVMRHFLFPVNLGFP